MACDLSAAELERRERHQLFEGDEIFHERCHRWHPVWRDDRIDRPYVRDFLFVSCNGAPYFVGQRGLGCRHLARRPTS
jgi:hypothetical protein